MDVPSDSEYRARLKETAERAAPAHALMLMAEQCLKAGVQIRSDVVHRLNVASVLPFRGWSTSEYPVVGRSVEELTKALLGELSPDDPLDAVHTCACFAILLVHEGKVKDVRNMATLTAMMMIEDLRQTDADKDGLYPVVAAKEEVWMKKAHSMLTRAQLLGYYHGTVH